MARKQSFLFVFLLTLIALPAKAGDIRHTFGDDPTNSFYVDDRGGSVNNGGSNNSYYLNLRDIDQSAYGLSLIHI